MLEIAKLEAFYGESQTLHGIDLKLAAGERVAVLGRNGAGKTTLFRSIMNGGPTLAGSIRLDGQPIADMRSHQIARLGLSLVPEDRRIFPHLTVVENMMLPRAAARGAPVMEVEELLRIFPMLEPLRARKGNQLSGGQQQLLAVARGFLPRPRLVLLDEPTEGLAPIIIQQMLKAVRELCEAVGSGLLLCEQNIWFARRCTERVYIIDNGHIVFQGDWSEFDRSEDIKHRYLAV